MTTITPCLWFDGNGLEAAELYVSVIPDSRVTDVSYYGPDQPGKEGSVLTVAFELAGRPYTALNGGPAFKFTEAISLQVSAADQDEVDRYTERLTADGGEVGPCGWVKDRFGLSWQVVPEELVKLVGDPNPVRANAAVQAMLGMTKIDIQALRDAADAAGVRSAALPA
ncbi:MAG: putative 3-demethylubiquinone-9 3-methyltransferase [Actinomycetia bacterium]|nr:putative 3-demethylubiquinone-9 3-methyltransferase [Actinomycetes bacterium]